ncbi:MAG: hypothetical protein JST80_02285 [Bdellovibrionales bacterium]|nr:hypothetical protein [Bdellovibrionales bacterium]
MNKSFSKSLVGAVLLATFSLSAAEAADMLDTSNPSCHFAAYKGGKWVRVSSSEVPTTAFSSRTPSKTQSGVSVTKLNNVWYSFNDSCAVSSGGSGGGGGSSTHVWFAELGLVYPKAMGDGVDGGPIASGSATGVMGAYQNSIGWSIGFGKHLSPTQSIFATFKHYGGKQDTTLSSSGQTGTLAGADSFTLFGVGFRHAFSTSTFAPFLEAQVGYGSASTTITTTGFTAGLAGYNGVTEFSSSSLWFALKLGANWNVSDSISVVPSVGYEKYSGSTATVKSSTSTLYTTGQSITASASGWLTFGANLQYNF